MTDVYVIRNQLGHYWGKGKTWVDGRDPHTVQRTRHEDEAINTLFELSSKDFELRGEVMSVPLSERDEPVVEPSEHPLPTQSETEAQTEGEAVTAHPAGHDATADATPEPERAAPTA